MKKVFLAVALTTLLLCNANAQNSDVEIAMQETKTEKFLKECNFVREDQITSYIGKGLEIYAKIFTDLETGNQIAALEFFTQNQAAAGAAMNALASIASDGESGKVVSEEEMAPKPLGYLDMENVGDLITALENIVALANNASRKDAFSVSYTAPGGIDVYFSQGIKDMWGVKGDASVYFRKKWYGINEFGTRSVQYVRTKSIKVENIAKIIPIIKDAQLIAEQQIKTVIPTKTNQSVYTSKSVNSTVVETVVTTPKVTDIAEVTPVAQESTAVVETTEKIMINDPVAYKAQLNADIVQVVNKYNSNGLLKSAICTSYTQCVRALLNSQSAADLQDVEKLTAFVESILDKNSMVDRKALEKQLSSAKTITEKFTIFESCMK